MTAKEGKEMWQIRRQEHQRTWASREEKCLGYENEEHFSDSRDKRSV